MANLTGAFEALQNASLLEAATEAYTESTILGNFFWPILFAFFLTLIYIKTESPAYIAIFSIIGAFTLKGLLLVANPMLYGYLVFSFALTLWSFFGSSRTDV